MNYELAKELKDAGFPNSRMRPHMDVEGKWSMQDQPTLSELIEACKVTIELTNATMDGTWLAKSEGDKYRKYGSTPSEAVAHLYLALNKPLPTQTIK